MSVQDYEQLTLFQGDSPASRFPWLESKKVKGMTVTSGRKCYGLSENLRRVGLSVKTYLESSRLPGEQYVRIWSVKDALSPFLILKLRLSERCTGEKEYSLLPTVTKFDATCGNLMGKEYDGKSRHAMKLIQAIPLWKTPVTADANNREFYRNSRGEPNLSAQVKAAPSGPPPKCVKMWPTPKASDCKGSGPAGSPSAEHDLKKRNLKGVVMYPTPKAQNARGSGERHGDGGPSLDVVIGGQLNPTWVEWLMGFPLGWTDLNA